MRRPYQRLVFSLATAAVAAIAGFDWLPPARGQGPNPSPPGMGGYAPQPVGPSPSTHRYSPAQPGVVRAPKAPFNRVQPAPYDPDPTAPMRTPQPGGARPWLHDQIASPPSPVHQLPGPVFRNPLVIDRDPAPAYNRSAAARGGWLGLVPSTEQAAVLRAAATGGDIGRTRQAVAASLRHDPSLSGYMAAIDVLGQANVDPSFAQPYRARAQHIAFQQVRAGAAEPLPWVATAGFALQDQNRALFRTATQQILERFPDNPHGHYYAGVQAIEDGDWDAAENRLRHAEQLGMPKESVAEMLKLAIDRQRWVWQYAIIIAVVAVVWLVGLGLIYGLGVWLSSLTLRAAQRDEPAATNATEHRLRWFYRRVIDAAGLYYFLSLPILLVLSVALPLALCYAALMLPYLNLWFVVAILTGGIAGIVTAASGIRTAFVRVPDQVDGRQLHEHEAPAFWGVLREVAESVGTRPVDEVWITPRTDMSVMERGSSYSKIRGKGRRVLVMGLGLIPEFRSDALKAVLAHEYAHFQHGDTAGGDVAYRVQSAMYRYADAIGQRGPVKSWDLVVWYLKLYFRLFHKLTFGASRLQEVLADRCAVECYGGAAFITGLGHVVRRDIEFNTLLNEAVKLSMHSQERAVAFYAPSKALTSDQREDVSGQVRDVYQLPETTFDSHPPLSKRFAAARRLGLGRPVGPEKVVSLFDASAPQLAKEMLAVITTGVESEAKASREFDAQRLKQVEASIEYDPSFELIEQRAVLNYRAGRYDLALDDLDLLLEVSPNDLAVLLSRSNLLEAMQNYNRMAKDLGVLRKYASHLPPDLQFQTEMRLGWVLAKFGKHRHAAEAFRKALTIRPDSINAIMGRLRAAEKLGALSAEPMQHLVSKVSRLFPDEPELPRLAAAAGIELATPVSRTPPSRRPRPTSTRGVLVWGGLATAASLGVAITCLLWPTSDPQQEVKASGMVADGQFDAILDSAMSAIPESDLELADASLEVAANAVAASTEIPGPTESANTSTSADLRIRITAAAETSFDAPPEDAPALASADDSEIESIEEALTPSQVLSEAQIKLEAIGAALRDRERQVGSMLEPQTSQGVSWRVHLLPYLGLEDLYHEFELNEPWDSDHNRALVEKIPEVYELESERGFTRFRVFVGDRLLVRPEKATESRFAVDGAATTTLAYFVGEEQKVEWTRPDTEALSKDEPIHTLGLGADDPIVLLMASGEVRAFERGLHSQKLWAFATAQSAEAINDQWFSSDEGPDPPRETPTTTSRMEGKPETEIYVRFPTVKSPRTRGGGTTGASDPIEQQLRRIGLAMHNHHEVFRCLPTAPTSKYRDASGKPFLSWRVHLLPFLDQELLYREFRLDEPWDSPHNLQLVGLLPDIYRSSPREKGETRFLGLSGPYQVFEGGGGLKFANMNDGLQNTIAVVHAGPDKAVPWTQPSDLELDLEKPTRSLGRSRDAVHCLRVDGAVIRLPRRTPDELWAGLATYNGGELVDGDTARRYGKHSEKTSMAASQEGDQPDLNSMKQISLAAMNYADQHRFYPIDRSLRDESGKMKPMLSWRVEILPYLGQMALYKAFNRAEPWDSDHNRRLIEFMPDVFRDLDDSVNETRTRVMLLTGPKSAYESVLMTGRAPGPGAFRDGTASTIQFIQVDEDRAMTWTQPGDFEITPANLKQIYDRIPPRLGLLVAMADGSVHAIPPSIALESFVALATASGGEITDMSWRFGR